LNSRERAEEVVAGGFHECVAQRGRVRCLGGGAMTWLINIVRNKAIDALRSGKTERASTLALDEEAMAVAADARQQPQALPRGASVDARSVLPDRSASIALLRTILIAARSSARHRGIEPARAVPHIHEASCNTSSRAPCCSIYGKQRPTDARRDARYTPSNAARSPSATRGSRAARIFVGRHGGAIGGRV